jgi:hypothetical protein
MSILSDHKDTLLFSDWTIGQRTLSVAGEPATKSLFSVLPVFVEPVGSSEGVAKVHPLFNPASNVENLFSNPACLSLLYPHHHPLAGRFKERFSESGCKCMRLFDPRNPYDTFFSS